MVDRNTEVVTTQAEEANPPVVIETLPAPPKPAYESKTIVASWVGIVFMILAACGVVYTDQDVATWIEIAEKVAPYAIGASGFVITWWSRRRALSPIKGGPSDPKVIEIKTLEARIDNARKNAFKDYMRR